MPNGAREIGHEHSGINIFGDNGGFWVMVRRLWFHIPADRFRTSLCCFYYIQMCDFSRARGEQNSCVTIQSYSFALLCMHHWWAAWEKKGSELEQTYRVDSINILSQSEGTVCHVNVVHLHDVHLMPAREKQKVSGLRLKEMGVSHFPVLHSPSVWPAAAAYLYAAAASSGCCATFFLPVCENSPGWFGMVLSCLKGKPLSILPPLNNLSFIEQFNIKKKLKETQLDHLLEKKSKTNLFPMSLLSYWHRNNPLVDVERLHGSGNQR